MRLKIAVIFVVLLASSYSIQSMERAIAPKEQIDYLQQLPVDVRRYLLQFVAYGNPVQSAKNILALAGTSKNFHALINEPATMVAIFKSIRHASYALDVHTMLEKKIFSLPIMNAKEIKELKREAKCKVDSISMYFRAMGLNSF